MIIGFLLLLMGAYIVIKLHSLGVFTKIGPENNPKVEVLATVPGPEDLEIDREQGILFFISNDPCAGFPEPGGIFYLYLNSNALQAVEFQFESPQDFHPHGLSYFRENHHQYLFTNNHRTDGTHTVEIFKISGDNRLEHQLTVKGPELTSPNDLAAAGPRQFYVTNDGRSHDRFTRSVDTFLGRKTGNILFYDGNKFIKVVDNLFFPNGIALNSERNELYAAETLSGKIYSYQLAGNYHLQNVDNFYIQKGIDNINLDAEGDLIASIHPNLWALSRHMQDPQKRSPSRVIHIDSDSKRIQMLYQHSGTEISGVSSAVSYNGSLYLGAVCDHKLVKLTIDD